MTPAGQRGTGSDCLVLWRPRGAYRWPRGPHQCLHAHAEPRATASRRPRCARSHASRRARRAECSCVLTVRAVRASIHNRVHARAPRSGLRGAVARGARRRDVSLPAQLRVRGDARRDISIPTTAAGPRCGARGVAGRRPPPAYSLAYSTSCAPYSLNKRRCVGGGGRADVCQVLCTPAKRRRPTLNVRSGSPQPSVRATPSPQETLVALSVALCHERQGMRERRRGETRFHHGHLHTLGMTFRLGF